MATQTWQYQGPKYRCLPDSTALILKYPEAATQTFKAGDFLTINSTGQVAIAVAATSTYASADVDTTNIIGMALNDASGTTNTPVSVVVATETTLFLVQATKSGGSEVTATSHLNKKYDLAHYQVGGVNGWGYTTDDTTAPNVVVVELYTAPGEAVGDTNGRAWVKILSTKRQFEVGQ